MIVIISSPSGAGKTTICEMLLKKDRNLRISISDTTRIPRDNECNGKDYNFISEDCFKERIKNSAYVEYAIVFKNYYGSSHANVMKLLKDGYDVLFDIDWQGAKQLKNSNYSNILSFFIMPPSKNIIYDRLLQRSVFSGDNEEAINMRMAMYETEIKHKDEYDYIIINNNLVECVNKIHSLISNKRKELEFTN
jgi:guanylate kinase